MAISESTLKKVKSLALPCRIHDLKDRMLTEPRYLSIEQALIITDFYKNHAELSTPKKRAMSLAKVMREIKIKIEPEELIVGNRTAGVRAGVVFPEAGISWINSEIEGLPTRVQDTFNVHPDDITKFREIILPYWQGKTLEDSIRKEVGSEVDAIAKVVKINQKDHAQGHICPDVKKWLALGPSGLRIEAEKQIAGAEENKRKFYECVIIVLDAACDFMLRYANLANTMAEDKRNGKYVQDLKEVARICSKLAVNPAESFHEAVQSMWFLFTLLHLESNSSSFSPGRADQYLYPYFTADMNAGRIDLQGALEIVEALWLKFNQIVYMRNSNSAKYFAGFPIGFNVALGGQTPDGEDASNELSYLFLRAQEHIGLPQPNLSVRLFEKSPDSLLDYCSQVISKGSGMPQVFNDESIIPALEKQGISHKDAMDYGIVGCVELTPQGNNLGWSDSAMFNLVKVLELTLNGGVCLVTGKKIGLDTGTLETYRTYEELEKAYQKQIDYYTEKMISACEKVEDIHQRFLPSAFLSSVINDCLQKGLDVTKGGAHYNFSGIQAIQVANIADSLAALKYAVFEKRLVSSHHLLEALRKDFNGEEELRLFLLNKIPKYGNDVEWVDLIGEKWIEYFANRLSVRKNFRGGRYHTGMYTVSSHVPMGANVGATPDGRKAKQPLADGGMSAVYGRDTKGPTSLLKSVSRIDSSLGSNGTLLNMKFLPQLFKTSEGIHKFSGLLKSFVRLRINHVQFNVVRKEDLLAAQKHPDQYRSLTVRVAGYTAYFTELAHDLQDEIIARTTYIDT